MLKPDQQYRATTRGTLLRDQSGITALEFAMITPVFLLMIIGILEFSSIMFTTAVMESATNITSRLGKTGYVAEGGTREQQIIDSVANRTAGLLDPQKITIESKAYSNFNKIGQPEPCLSPNVSPCPGTPGINFIDINGNGAWDADMGKAGLGNAGDVVVYTVTYPWPVMTPLIGNIIGNTFNITVRTVVRNEPYGTS
jgi:Flp pilus assembly protein TadG